MKTMRKMNLFEMVMNIEWNCYTLDWVVFMKQFQMCSNQSFGWSKTKILTAHLTNEAFAAKIFQPYVIVTHKASIIRIRSFHSNSKSIFWTDDLHLLPVYIQYILTIYVFHVYFNYLFFVAYSHKNAIIHFTLKSLKCIQAFES